MAMGYLISGHLNVPTSMMKNMYYESVMVFNATFNNISVISWRSVLLVEETGENHRPAASRWQTLSHNIHCITTQCVFHWSLVFSKEDNHTGGGVKIAIFGQSMFYLVCFNCDLILIEHRNKHIVTFFWHLPWIGTHCNFLTKW